MRMSEILRRSGLGTGWYIIREDHNCPLPYAPGEIFDAIIAAGACCVTHSGMYQRTASATALPGGCMYELGEAYGFGGMPARSWLFGARAVRHVLRLLDISQPGRLLSGEKSIPTMSPLDREWNDFTQQARLSRVGASLGALAWMRYAQLPGSRESEPDGMFEPLTLPVQWTEADAPPEVKRSWIDPRIRDGFFWTAESTTVIDSEGQYTLTPDGKLTPKSK